MTADLIIEGRVATLAGDRGFGWVQALAIADGVVLGAGARADAEGLAGRATRRWRVPDDSVVLPGITDAHLHMMMMIISERHVDLSAEADIEAALATLAAAHAEMVDRGDVDGWLLGHGWSLDRFGRWPDADLLERACPGRPVALYAHDHHSRWVSHSAMRLAGIDGDISDPPGGMLRRDEAGRLTGILHETACSAVDRAIPDPAAAELEAGLVRVAARLAELGITGCHDPGELGDDVSLERGPLFYGDLAARGRLPLRVHASVRAPQLERAIALNLHSGDGVEPESDDPRAQRLAHRYRMGWLKLFADGSLGSRSAAMLEPYSDAAQRAPTGGPRGMFLSGAQELRRDLVRAAEAGISGQVHAIGDAAVRMVLDVLDGLPPTPLMRRIEHAQVVAPEDQPRFGALGIAASLQPVHLRSDAGPSREAWGDRTENSFPLRALDEGGALIPLGTDAPVEPVDPWPGIAVAVSRRDPYRPADEPVGGHHAVELARAIRAACLDPALVARQEGLGRLVAGSPADLIVVPAASLREPIEPARLASTRPLATLIDGEVVYAQPGFELS